MAYEGMKIAAEGLRIEDGLFASLDQSIHCLFRLADTRADDDVDMGLSNRRPKTIPDAFQRIVSICFQFEVPK